MLEVAEKIYTVEEYFALERQSEIRHEFVHGNLIAMPGESKIANQICLNCAVAIKRPLREKGFEIFTHEVRLIVRSREIYRYPDLVVAPKSDDADTHAITQPSLIIEVLSESTEQQNRGKKLQEYLNLSSLQYYLLIAQKEYRVECYRRRESTWEYLFYTQPTESLNLDFYPLNLSLKDIYEDVQC